MKTMTGCATKTNVKLKLCINYFDTPSRFVVDGPWVLFDQGYDVRIGDRIALTAIFSSLVHFRFSATDPGPGDRGRAWRLG
ncbi:hypothetical protein N7468_000526 [Penicillium chermesinum]|uniref:Uncharacterized protein n=1 Tax=Penicillium chermesinum TaxID=63820 RepID=A0A9W9PKG0_9EURO|nr:uncharacterized protein N7468_000526 [Penicillium chermesinum]KAJ5249075.1 hypothetical protein N7468_000526 [Penicillium chermesinum]